MPGPGNLSLYTISILLEFPIDFPVKKSVFLLFGFFGEYEAGPTVALFLSSDYFTFVVSYLITKPGIEWIGFC